MKSLRLNRWAHWTTDVLFFEFLIAKSYGFAYAFVSITFGFFCDAFLQSFIYFFFLCGDFCSDAFICIFSSFARAICFFIFFIFDPFIRTRSYIF
jgi:hypothetical protein